VLFRKGAVESYSANPYGQSDHPDSPHYTDQAERLFSKRRLKPTWFEREWLEGHIESTTVLEWR
jgi:acyl-homoserine lactone acylase PvdQ